MPDPGATAVAAGRGNGKPGQRLGDCVSERPASGIAHRKALAARVLTGRGALGDHGGSDGKDRGRGGDGDAAGDGVFPHAAVAAHVVGVGRRGARRDGHADAVDPQVIGAGGDALGECQGGGGFRGGPGKEHCAGAVEKLGLEIEIRRDRRGPDLEVNGSGAGGEAHQVEIGVFLDDPPIVNLGAGA